MSKLGRVLLRLCNDQLQVNVDVIKAFFPELSKSKIKHYARQIGLSIKPE